MGVRGYLIPRNSRLGNSRFRNSRFRNSRIPKKIFYFSTLKTLGILEFFLVLFKNSFSSKKFNEKLNFTTILQKISKIAQFFFENKEGVK